ncbi:MAG: thioredoxin family protein [Bacteroidota bacterium]
MRILLCTALVALSSVVMGQSKSQEITLPDGATFLLGEIVGSHLQSEPYNEWFQSNYDNYVVDSLLLALVQPTLKEHELLLFLGTWCGDSKREVPRLLKILDQLHFPVDKLTMVALDRRKEQYKKSPEGQEEGHHIIRVPTLIVLKDGKEVNRIVESPVDSLEEDLFAILTDLDYIPNYAE